ncbi:MAG: site-2 protease family protein [Phycisphaerae bacterium]|nr:site-2 protease family protein [Phycisphaerae bacterium]
MSEKKDIASRNLKNALVLAAMIGLFIWWVYTDIGRAANVMLALIGLGAVIFVHEFGHFIAGKLTDINVEAFALGFGPVVLGVKKFENFLQVRILPTILVKSDDDDKGLLCFKLPVRCKAGETEYQLRIFPVGGFVKLLGQEDIGADKPSDDPRSFLNKATWKRVLVAANGVVFNVILAIAFFIVVFTIGIKMSPAIIGDCLPGFPADKAGLKAGDEIIEINGKANPDFRGVALIAAFSGKNEPVSLKVKRTDGSVENLAVIAKDMPGMGFKGFGITPAGALEIAKVENPKDLFERTGLKTDDVLTAVGEDKVEQSWQYRAAMQNLFEPSVALTFQRAGQAEPVVKNFELIFAPALKYEEEGNFVPANIYGLMPRLKIISIELPEANEVLQKGDIIVRAAEAANPTYKELRQITTAYVEKELSITVLRNNELVETTVIPKKEPNGRAVIGIGVGLDVENPVVAATADANTFLWPSDLPKGAEIVAIAGKKVENYFDIAAVLGKNKGKTVKVEYSVALNSKKFDFAVPAEGNFIQARAELLQELPFKPLSRLYRAAGPADALKMGFRKTVEFIAQTYMTLKGLIIGSVSPKSLMGPVGMIAASSRIIAEKEFMQYLHFMGIISACLAVMNFLPLPILDGGLVVMLIIEKIKGSPVHIKVQEWLTYAGLAIIGALFVLITYNDIIRVFFNR